MTTLVCLRCGEFLTDPATQTRRPIHKSRYICDHCSNPESGKLFAHLKYKSFYDLTAACYKVVFRVTRAKVELLLLTLLATILPSVAYSSSVGESLRGIVGDVGLSFLYLFLLYGCFRMIVAETLIVIGSGETTPPGLAVKLRRRQIWRALPMFVVESLHVLVLYLLVLFLLFSVRLSPASVVTMSPLFTVFLFATFYTVLHANIERQLAPSTPIFLTVTRSIPATKTSLLGFGAFTITVLINLFVQITLIEMFLWRTPTPATSIPASLLLNLSLPAFLICIAPFLVAIKIHDIKKSALRPTELEISLLKLKYQDKA